MFGGLGILGTVVPMLEAEETVCIWPSPVFWFLELVCSDVRASERKTATYYCCNLLFKTCTQL